MEIPLYNVDAEFCFLHISGFWLIFLICGLWCVAEPALVVDTIGKGGFVLLILQLFLAASPHCWRWRSTRFCFVFSAYPREMGRGPI